MHSKTSKMSNPSKRGRKDTSSRGVGVISTPYIFLAVSAVLVILYDWPLRWLISGAPTLSFLLFIGAANGRRIFPLIPLWPFLSSLNLLYAVCATSWLLYWVFTWTCYPMIFVTCLFQFQMAGDRVRRTLRSLLKQLHFTNDKIAFFDIPALEIDTEVDGLMVIRGITISLSSLTIVAHGVEVGIKLSDDLELALQTDSVVIKLFRSINVGDVYANVKGGEYEMTFGSLAESTEDADGEALMVSDTGLLKAAAAGAEASGIDMTKMIERMTGMTNEAPKPISAKGGAESITKVTADDDHASKKYHDILHYIEETSLIRESRKKVKKQIKKINGDETTFDPTNQNDMRAAICSELHDKPSVPHPPRRSVKVTTLQNLSSPRQRAFMHRLPMLLRLLLNPVSYLHPVKINSITAAGSGKWIQWMLDEHVFNHYVQGDSAIKHLSQRISSWLSDANFALQLANITGLAQVPFLTNFDILTELRIDDVMAYRTLAKQIDLKQVFRLGGADARIAVPSFLLPHHEHLLPPMPTKEDEREQQKNVEEADGKPKTVQAEYDLEQTKKDECNVKISAHARLPACFDQELLDFVAALVKATKVMEIEKDTTPLDEAHGFKGIAKALNSTMKDTMKRAAVDAVANDRWIAKLVGKVTRKLEKAQGDLGYSGDIPVPLAPYREVAESATKLLA